MPVQTQQGKCSMKKEMGFKSWQQSRLRDSWHGYEDFLKSRREEKRKKTKKTTLEAFGLSGKLDQLGIVFLIQSSHFYLIFLVTW